MCTFHAKREGLRDRVGRTALCLPLGSHINSTLFRVDRCQDAHIIVYFQHIPQPGDKEGGLASLSQLYPPPLGAQG